MCCNISAIHIWQGTVLARFAQDITANMDQSGEPTVVSAGGRQTQQAQRIRIGSGLRSAKMTHKNGKSYKVKFLNFFQLYFFLGNQNPGSGTGTRIRIYLKCWMLDTEPNPDPQHCFL